MRSQRKMIFRRHCVIGIHLKNCHLRNVWLSNIHSQKCYVSVAGLFFRLSKKCQVQTRGSVYVGQYENDKRHGEGTKVYANEGGKFEGHWKKGKRHGAGKRTYASGRVIEGEWRKGKRIRVFNNNPSAERVAKKSRTSS